MNAVLSVQGTAVSEETKPSFLSRVFNKKNALKMTKAVVPVPGRPQRRASRSIARSTSPSHRVTGCASAKVTRSEVTSQTVCGR